MVVYEQILSIHVAVRLHIGLEPTLLEPDLSDERANGRE